VPALVLASALPLALVACSATTVVTPSDPPDEQTVATTVPTGTSAELLHRLQQSVFGLSVAINEGHGKAALDEIRGLWVAARAQLSRTEAVDRIEHQLTLMDTAVERRRPADADKAARSVSALIDQLKPPA
jgi:hypothetical protein